jgi:hypothetical protein
MVEFEKQWLIRLANSLTKNFGSAYRDEIMTQIDQNGDQLNTTRSVLKVLTKSMPERKLHDTLTDTACFYPHNELIPFKELYQSTRDLSLVHRKLQEKFEKDIVVYKNLSPANLKHIRSKYWGVAGKLTGNTIIATKIPADYHNYFSATDRSQKNAAYCHCPRLKDSIKNDESIPYKYCYCGGGYYRDIWQFITGKDVTIEILKSILLGDEVCQFKIEIQE